MPNQYDIVIGLEVHAQLATKTKIFCGCLTSFGEEPNKNVCPVCAGLPGTLPVLNQEVFNLGLRAVLALGGTVSKRIKFDRKNYFYPDLPKGYQISQYDMPIGEGGYVDISTKEGAKRIGLTRLHLEEDAGKLIHDPHKPVSYVDLNRAGTPLAEIVSNPELKSPDEAYEYLTNLKAILKSVAVSNADMEKGQLRCDANISLRKTSSDPFGVKVEIKNVNSFKNVRDALTYEIERQSKMLDSGEEIVQETRLYDAISGKTQSMRSKEAAHDYRYFPEPDLVPFFVDEVQIKSIQEKMPELPDQKKSRYIEKFGLSDYDANSLVHTDGMAHLFEECAKDYSNYKTLSNWLMGPVVAYANDQSKKVSDFNFDYEGFLKLLRLVDDGRVSFKVAKEDIFPDWMKTNKDPEELLKDKGLVQISDADSLKESVDEAIQSNEKSVNDFKSGKKNALMFLVGQVMKKTKGKANPNMVKEMLEERLS